MSIIGVPTSTRAVASYLPAALTREIARGARAPASRAERLRGPVMFVDVAGFTPFVLSLCTEGQKGIETLNGVLIRYFEELVDRIYAYGGDVYHFAGDSMLIGFIRAPSESDGESAARAVACANAIRIVAARYERFEVLGRSHSMPLKVGIGLGDYHRVLIGRESFWLTSLILGKPIDAAIEAERHASGGEILLDEAMWSELPSPKDGAEIGTFTKLLNPSEPGPVVSIASDARGPALDDRLVERCARFMDPILFEKASTGHAGFEADFREVTCLFVRYGGLRLDGDVEHAMSMLNALFGYVQECAKTYRAVVNRVELGDKGFVFLFILGAPKAMESKCTLAGRLAMKLAHPPGVDTITVQAGIATGYGFCGDVGSPYRKEYTVTGEVVNLAARLMTYAESGGIYLDESTRARLDRRLVSTEIPGVALKGMPGVSTIYRLHAEDRSHPDTQATKHDWLVGRKDELDVLRGLYRKICAGSGGSCLITGEPGVGKSRLASAFLALIGADEASVYEGSCYAHEQFTPYSVWKGMLREFLLIPERATAEQACALITRALAEIEGVSGEWGPVIAHSLGLEAKEEAFTRNLEPAQKTRRMFQIISQLIEWRSACEPLVFCIDDLHWIDDASMRLVEHLVARLGQSAVLFVLLSRDEHAASPLASAPGLRRVALSGLALEETRELLVERLDRREPDAALQRMVLERAEGNPLFVESILQSLREQDLLGTDKAGRVTLAGSMSQRQIPETVQELILTRIDRLDESEKTVLRVASVIGRVFDRSVLEILLAGSVDSPRLDAILARLEASGFVAREAGSPRAFQFRHVLITDVAYATLPLETRESLHRRAGEHIESTVSRDSDERVDLLSYHFRNANVPDKGLAYAMRAGRHSAAKFALRDAIYQLSTALEILERNDYRGRADDRFTVRRELADLFRQDGQYDRAMELLSRCLEQPLPPMRRADVHIGIGHVYQERGQASRAVEELETGLSLLGQDVPHGELEVRVAIVWGLLRRALLRMSPIPARPLSDEERTALEKQHEIMTHLGKIYWFSDLKRTGWTIVCILSVSERLQSPVKLSMAYSNFSLALLSRGLSRRARRYSEKSISIARETDDPGLLAFVRNRAAVFGIYCNEPLESVGKYQENLKLLDQIGEAWEKLSALGGMGAAYAMASDFVRCDEVLREVETLATEIDSNLHLGWSKCWRPFYRYLLGLEDVEEARRTIRSSIPFAMEYNDIGTQILAHAHLCAIAVRQGEGGETAWLADRVYTSLWRHRANTPVRTVQAAWVFAAEAAVHALEAGAEGDARERCHVVVKRCVAHCLRVGKHFPSVLGPALRIDACYKALMQARRPPTEAFEKAIAVLEAGPDRWQTGLVYREAARLVPARFGEYAAEARKIFQALRLSVELRRMDDTSP